LANGTAPAFLDSKDRVLCGFLSALSIAHADFGGWLAGMVAACSRASLAAGFAGKRLF